MNLFLSIGTYFFFCAPTLLIPFCLSYSQSFRSIKNLIKRNSLFTTTRQMFLIVRLQNSTKQLLSTLTIKISACLRIFNTFLQFHTSFVQICFKVLIKNTFIQIFFTAFDLFATLTTKHETTTKHLLILVFRLIYQNRSFPII